MKLIHVIFNVDQNFLKDYMLRAFIILLIVYTGWKLLSRPDYVSIGPGIYAGKTPEQNDINSSDELLINQYSIKSLAEFSIEAKILAKEDYYFDREAELSPTDLALGWGKMSDESVLENIEISQSNRFYWWRVDSFPIPREEIETHSANMHLIPANESVAKAIKGVRKGEIIKLEGTLVEAKSINDDWTWRSSLTRNDVGAGACELILVRDIYTIYP